MSKGKNTQRNLQKEDVLQAVLVADDFDELFADFTKEQSSVFIPVVNCAVIDYALECLGYSGIQETIIFCCSHADVIKEHVRNSKWSKPASPMNVTIIVSERCRSLGDAMRDIDNKAVIKGDFILLSAFSVSNLKLLNILQCHREQCARDKGAAMTLILQDVGKRLSKKDETMVAMNALTNRLLLYLKPGDAKKIEIPLEYLLDHGNLNVYSTLVDTGIAICSPSVPLLFSDNFDFQTKEDFIKGLLLNEEILDSRIYCYLTETGYGATIRNWETYQRVVSDILHRWSYPLVPDQFFTFEEPFFFHRNFIYKQPGVQLSNKASLEMDVAVGRGSHLENNVRVHRSVIGKNCKIGNDVDIQDSYIFDNCVIKDGCKVRLCVIGEKTQIGQNSILSKCFIKQNASIKDKTELDNVVVSTKPFCTEFGEDARKHDSGIYVMKIGIIGKEAEDDANEVTITGLKDPDVEMSDDETDQSSVSDIEESYGQSPEPDDTSLFYSEVVDSLQRGYEEKLSCDNLILEINSSRYAYNVTLSEVTSLTLKAILSLSSRVNANVRSLLSFFLPLLKNYVKSSEAQNDCLGIIEEIHEDLGNELTKSLHFLYDNDIIAEEIILSWHDSLEDDAAVRSKVAPLVKWLKEAAEESSSEESE